MVYLWQNHVIVPQPLLLHHSNFVYNSLSAKFKPKEQIQNKLVNEIKEKATPVSPGVGVELMLLAIHGSSSLWFLFRTSSLVRKENLLQLR